MPLLLALLSCSPAPAPGPAPAAAPGPGTAPSGGAAVALSPTVTVAAPWEVVSQDDDAIVLRLGDSGDGARVQLRRDAHGRVPGVTPIAGGKTWEVGDGADRWPLVAVGWPDRPLTKAEIEVKGVDLVVRLAGAPFDTLTKDPRATTDPALTWVRLRDRGGDWRVVLDGLGTLDVPADGLAASPGDDGGFRLEGPFGQMDVRTEAPKTSTSLGATRWWLSTVPSLDEIQPYKRTTITWRPKGSQGGETEDRKEDEEEE